MRRSRCTIPLVVFLFCVGSISSAQAQAPTSRMEVGALMSALRVDDLSAVNAGIGARFSYELTRWVAADVEFVFFPHDSARLTGQAPGSPAFQVIYERRRAEALFGVKTGWRGDRIGLFAKARPGITRLAHKGVDCVGNMCALILLALPEYRTEFAVDLGGIVEFYPTPRTVARLDMGDVVIRQRGNVGPCRNCVTHNFSSRVGIGWRF
jgi:hypothetical protein